MIKLLIFLSLLVSPVFSEVRYGAILIRDKEGDSLQIDGSGAVAMEYRSVFEISKGNHYFKKGWADISDAGTVTHFMFTTPSAIKRIYARALLDSEAEFLVEIYEGAIASDSGTEITTFNNDRESLNVPLLKMYAGPTISDSGTCIWPTKIGTGRNPTGVSPGLNYFIKAKSNTIYLFAITKEVPGTHYLNYDFFWFESET